MIGPVCVRGSIGKILKGVSDKASARIIRLHGRCVCATSSLLLFGFTIALRWPRLPCFDALPLPSSASSLRRRLAQTSLGASVSPRSAGILQASCLWGRPLDRMHSSLADPTGSSLVHESRTADSWGAAPIQGRVGRGAVGCVGLGSSPSFVRSRLRWRCDDQQAWHGWTYPLPPNTNTGGAWFALGIDRRSGGNSNSSSRDGAWGVDGQSGFDVRGGRKHARFERGLWL